MDTMHRLLASTAAALLLTAALGCHHTAGMCDCDHGWNACCEGGTYPMMHAAAMQAEPIKAMPRAGEPIGK